MQGVFLHVADDGKRLAAVGTTGTILFKATVPAPDGADDMPMNDNRPGVILSAETVNAVLRLYRSADVVNVIVNANSIFFYTDSTRFCSSLLVGTYPNYLPLISNPAAESVVVAANRAQARSLCSKPSPRKNWATACSAPVRKKGS